MVSKGGTTAFKIVVLGEGKFLWPIKRPHKTNGQFTAQVSRLNDYKSFIKAFEKNKKYYQRIEIDMR